MITNGRAVILGAVVRGLTAKLRIALPINLLASDVEVRTTCFTLAINRYCCENHKGRNRMLQKRCNTQRIDRMWIAGLLLSRVRTPADIRQSNFPNLVAIVPRSLAIDQRQWLGDGEAREERLLDSLCSAVFSQAWNAWIGGSILLLFNYWAYRAESLVWCRKRPSALKKRFLTAPTRI